MKETLDKAYKAVKKFGESIDKKFIEVSIVRSSTYDGRETKPDYFKAYVPDCGYMEGDTIEALIKNLDAEYTKRGRPVTPSDDILDLPF
jgi:hypothetical protein